MPIGLDLGSAQVGIAVPSRHLVLRQPAAVAVDSRTRRVLAVGESALRMQGRTSRAIEVMHPLEEGIAAAPDLVEVLVRHLIVRGLGWRRWLHPSLLVSVPVTITPIEKEALQEVVAAAGGGQAALVSAPLAALQGAGVDVNAPLGRMVMDIGAGHTQAAVVYMGTLVASDASPVGGRSLDAAIARFLRDELGVVISIEQAEALKQSIGTATPGPEPVTTEVRGRDTRTGLPITHVVDTVALRRALSEPLRRIAELARAVLAKTPPEMATDLLEQGVLLTGGGSRLQGLDTFLQSECGVPVHLAPHPESCSVVGTTGLRVA